ncbi:DUF305 domain-containing protein [Actinomadura sp. LOL_016]|uniref:DUF305 domain-containing protein n=1 Tax=unclassified Actinomadura TaxID=2626254 RepID=UPI003A7FC6D2
MNARRAVAAVLVPLLLTAACGGGPAEGRPVSAASEVAAKHNDGDVMFLQMMIEHHGQGIEMAELAAERTRREEVRILAGAVKATQTEEAKRMVSWLRAWSKPLKAPHAHGHHAHGHHAHDGAMPGTTAREIDALRETEGTAFETAFLNLFIAHQHNAVEMAGTELREGANPDAKAFAERVRRSRTDQVKQLLGLLNA